MRDLISARTAVSCDQLFTTNDVKNKGKTVKKVDPFLIVVKIATRTIMETRNVIIQNNDFLVFSTFDKSKSLISDRFPFLV